MKIIIAIDSFKGSLSSNELNESLEKGIRKIYSQAEIIKIPIADGGEGTVEALVQGTGGEFIQMEVKNPLMKNIIATYGILGDKKTAIIEMASASGLPLIAPEERDPLKTTTFGTGELVKDAIQKGCREFILGIGGSATNDGGLGMMQALGFKLFGKNGEELGYGGEIMEKVVSIDSSNALKELKECNFLVACDVDNPFYGPKGAAHIFSRQKGADDEAVEILDRGLEVLSKTLHQIFGKEIGNLPGAGAAGGLGGGLVAFLDATLKPGVDIILEEVGLEKHLEGTDFIITGEGRMDFQTVMGKAPIGVAKLAKKYDIPVIGITGSIGTGAEKTHDFGIESFFSIMDSPMTLEDAMNKENAKRLVEQGVQEIFRLIRVCQNRYSK